jgi:hypothetical protein
MPYSTSLSLPKGVRQTEDPFIFLVPFDLLQRMEFPDDPTGEVVPVNARHLGAKPNHPMSGKGLSLDEMGELRTSVQDEGWFGTFLCRWVRRPDGVGVQVVAGERRYLCVAKLREGNEPCRDRRKDVRDKDGRVVVEGKTPARELFAHLRCEVMDMTDEEAITFNWLENDKHAPVGERAAVGLVKRMRAWGWDDGKIMDHVKRGDQWLRDTDKLCELDPACFEAVCEGRVNRNGAMLLARIVDPKERVEVMRVACEMKRAASQPVIDRKSQEVDRAEVKEELAKCRVADAQCQGDSAAKEKATKELETAHGAVEKKKGELEKAKEAATVKQKDIRHGINAVQPTSIDNDGGALALRPNKIQARVVEPILAMIEQNGVVKEGRMIDVTILEALRDVLVGVVLAGKADKLVEVLDRYAEEDKDAKAA